MPFLEPPIRLLDAESGGTWSFEVERVEWGDVFVQPRSEPNKLLTRALRLHLPQTDESEAPDWWDVTSKQLQVALGPLLPWVIERRRRLRIRQVGTPPRVAYSVDLLS
jgi:hypothetical protein